MQRCTANLLVRRREGRYTNRQFKTIVCLPLFLRSDAVFHLSKTFAIFAASVISFVLMNIDSTSAQTPLPFYVAPSPVVSVPAAAVAFAAPVAVPVRVCCRRTNYVATVPVQVNYAAYYAPQVPVVPMSPWPVPTMSAYYVPTIPVVQAYYAPAVTVRRARRYAVPVAPAAIYPVYWRP